MKKKAIKIAAASAVAASAFVAAAPQQSEAASNVKAEVSKAVTQMQVAYHTYSDVTAAGNFADINAVNKEYGAAQKAYQNAKALVLKAGGTQKEAYLAQLDVNYNDFIGKRVVTYIDAYKYATTLGNMKTQLDAALTAKDWDKAETLYNSISRELKSRTVILDRVYGKTTRELLRSQYKASAQTLRDSLVYDITVKMYVKAANDKLAAKDFDGAKKALEVVDANLAKVDKNSEFGKVLADLATKAKADLEAATVVKVDSVSATASKKLEVKFSKEVDTTKAQITVKKGTSNVGVAKVTFSDDKKSAVLDLSNKLTEGTYTVSVAGLTDTALTTDVVAQNERVETIKFTSDVAVKTAGGVDIAYQVQNQYGENISTSGLADVIASVSGATSASASNGVVSVTGDYKVGDKVAVTLVDRASGKSGTATVTTVAESKPASLTVDSLYSKNGKTLTEDTATTANNFFLVVNAKDQYGKEITNLSDLNTNAFTKVTSTGVTLGNFTYEVINNERKVVIPVTFAANALKGDYSVTLVSNSTGSSVTYKVTMAEGTKVDSVALGAPEGLVAGGESVLIPLEVADNKGVAVTDLTTLQAGIKTLNVDGATGEKLVVKDGKAYIQATTSSVAANSTGNLVVTVQTETNKIATKVISVKPNAEPKSISGLSTDVTKTLLEGQDLTLDWSDFVVVDQYGRTMEMDEDTTNYRILASDDATVEGAVNITTASTEGTTPDTIVLNGVVKGSEFINFVIQKFNGTAFVPVAGSDTDVQFNVVAKTQFTSYEVAPIATLYAGDTSYTKSFKVYGVTSTGEKVLLPASEYNVVFDKNSISATPALDLNIDKAANTIAVGEDLRGTVVDDTDSPDVLPTTKEYTVKVVINNAAATELTTKVVVSAEAPKVVDFGFTTDGTSVGTALSKLAFEVSTATPADDDATVANLTGDLDFADLDTFLYFVDQYGKKTTTTTAAAYLTFSNLADAAKSTDTPAGLNAAIASNGSKTASVTNLEAGDTVTVKVGINGVEKSIAVEIK